MSMKVECVCPAPMLPHSPQAWRRCKPVSPALGAGLEEVELETTFFSGCEPASNSPFAPNCDARTDMPNSPPAP